jgi:tryprostatin B 6-hydroxylase
MSLTPVALCAFAGLLAHSGIFIHFEHSWHLRLKVIVFGHLAFGAGCYYFAQHFYTTSVFFYLVAMQAAYFASLFMSMSIYRLLFSRLVSFPGPKLAAVTKFWHVYQARNSQNHLVMQRMHEQYGPFVRTGTALIPSNLLEHC